MWISILSEISCFLFLEFGSLTLYTGHTMEVNNKLIAMYLGESLSRNELGKYKYRHTIPEFIFILTIYKKQLSGQMTLKWARHSYSLILSDSTEGSLE